MKKIVSLLIVILLLSAPVFADNSIKVTIDGSPIEFDVQPVMVNERVLVPMRKIFETLGAEVHWIGETRSIQASKGNIKIEMQIENFSITVNGNTITLDTPPMLIDSKTLVPVRAVAEGLRAKVDWNQDSTTVIIQSGLHFDPMGENLFYPSMEARQLHYQLRYRLEQRILPASLIDNNEPISAEMAAGAFKNIGNYIADIWNADTTEILADYLFNSGAADGIETDEEFEAFVISKRELFNLTPEQNFAFLFVEIDDETNAIVIKMGELPEPSSCTFTAISYNEKKGLRYFILERNSDDNFMLSTMSGDEIKSPHHPISNDASEFTEAIKTIMNSDE